MKFLVGTLCGGLMEDPELYIQPPYLIIDAKSKGEAINRYNGKTHAHFFYGDVIARINNDKLEDINKYISEKQAYDIYNEAIKNTL